jgi:hypothetical protein
LLEGIDHLPKVVCALSLPLIQEAMARPPFANPDIRRILPLPAIGITVLLEKPPPLHWLEKSLKSQRNPG